MASEASLHLDRSCIAPLDIDGSDTSRPRLSRSVGHGKRSNFSILGELWKLRLGVGRLSRDEYFELRLFDNDLYEGVDKKAFVGLEAARRIWFQANYRVDLFALANNKIASAIWFAAHGLPILPTIALFHEATGRPNSRLLRSDAELRTFLRKSEHYPLFGKPIEGSRSIGSASIECYVASNDSLITTAGQSISVDNFVAYVKTHAASGYQFQTRISPHATIREMCGDRLATVRLLTIMRGGKPELIRACWKIPAGMHAADNFWRPGNLLAQLDLDSGRVLKVIRGAGTECEEISHHPDTGVRILGMNVPNWQKTRQLAMDGAKLLDELPLVGWDIAPVDSGAVLVEPNVTPDFGVHQMADRRGMLDATFINFLHQRKRDAADFLRAGKRAAPRTGLASFSDRAREALSILMPSGTGHRP
jgi:Sugar-transfer associated ATP-grasp